MKDINRILEDFIISLCCEWFIVRWVFCREFKAEILRDADPGGFTILPYPPRYGVHRR